MNIPDNSTTTMLKLVNLTKEWRIIPRYWIDSSTKLKTTVIIVTESSRKKPHATQGRRFKGKIISVHNELLWSKKLN